MNPSKPAEKEPSGTNDGAASGDSAAGDDHAVSGLYSAYVAAHARLSYEQFRAKLLRGVAVLEDLDLVMAERFLPQLKALRSTVADDGPIRTRELQHLLDRMLSLTLEDGLTGLFNRRYFDHRLGQELERSRREQTCCSIMLVDIDDFKQINDNHGHDVGDRLLKHVSALCRKSLRASDEITARVGGEEFAIILPNTGIEQAPIVGERLRARVHDTPFPEQLSSPATLSISIGVATACPQNPIPPVELVKRADVALYRAKRSGKNTVRAYEQGSDAENNAEGGGDK